MCNRFHILRSAGRSSQCLECPVVLRFRPAARHCSLAGALSDPQAGVNRASNLLKYLALCMRFEEPGVSQ